MTLPDDQLKAVGVGSGDLVWVALNPDKQGTLVVIPEAVYGEIMRKGWIAIGG